MNTKESPWIISLLIAMAIPFFNIIFVWCDGAGGGIQIHHLIQLAISFIGYPVFVLCGLILLYKGYQRELVLCALVVFNLMVVRSCTTSTPSSRGKSCWSNPFLIFEWPSGAEEKDVLKY